MKGGDSKQAEGEQPEELRARDWMARHKSGSDAVYHCRKVNARLFCVRVFSNGYGGERAVLNLFLAFGQFSSPRESALGALVHLVANRPVIFPKEIPRLVRAGVDQQEGSLEIVHYLLIG